MTPKTIEVLKAIGDSVTLQLINTNSVTPYNNLQEFLSAIEQEESIGNDIFITQVWLSGNKVMAIYADDEVLHLIPEIIAIQFTSRKVAKSLTEEVNYIMHGRI